MLLEGVDFYGLLFLAPFLVLELFWRWRAAAVTLAVFGFTFVVGRAWGACCRNGAWWTGRRSAPGAALPSGCRE